MIPYIFLTLCLVSLYGYLQYSLATNWDRLPVDDVANMSLPLVSVIVAVRNEAANVEACLFALAHQDYPPTDFEIILVDNHSTDSTLDLVRERCLSIANLTVIDLASLMPADKAYKKEALRAGIGRATGQYILTTDGDCKVPFRWITTMVQALHNPSVEFVTGPIKMESAFDFLSQYQGIDLAGLMIATGGGIQSGRLLLANGANMGFSKSRFEELGGYEDHLDTASGDDVFMIQQLYREDPGSVRFVKSKEAMVLTRFESGIVRLFRQRKRWAAKSGKLEHGSTKAISVLVFLNSLWLLLHLPLIAIYGYATLYLFVAHLFLKICADQQLLSRGLTYFSIQSSAYTLLLAHIFNPLLNVAVGLSTLASKRYMWKDRSAH